MRKIQRRLLTGEGTKPVRNKVLSPYYQFSKFFCRLPHGACLRLPSRLLCETGYEA